MPAPGGHVKYYKLGLFLTLFSVVLLPLNGAFGDTRGIRNHNPANLVKTDILWQGEKEECSDTRFECFSTPHYGLRAMYKNIYTYYYKYNKKTIREIIHRWSPPNENKTNSLVKTVSNILRIHPDNVIPIRNMEFLTTLGSVIIKMENGEDPYSQQTHIGALRDASRNTYYAGRGTNGGDSKTLGYVSKSESRTTKSPHREGHIKREVSKGSKGVQGRQELLVYKENDSNSINLCNHSLPTSDSPILRPTSNSWLDRVGERIPFLYRREGCYAMERSNRISNNTATHPSSSSNIWAILRRKHLRQVIRNDFISLVIA